MPVFFYNQGTSTDRQMDGCRSQKRAGTSTLRWCQVKMLSSARRPHVCLSLLPRERYYLWMPELFMHGKITPWVGQNETGAGLCDGYRIIFITAPEAWASGAEKKVLCWKKVLWSETNTVSSSHLTASTCCPLTLVIVIIQLQSYGYRAVSSYINANKMTLLYWLLEDRSPSLFSSPFQGGQVIWKPNFPIKWSVSAEILVTKWRMTRCWPAKGRILSEWGLEWDSFSRPWERQLCLV